MLKLSSELFSQNKLKYFWHNLRDKDISKISTDSS